MTDGCSLSVTAFTETLQRDNLYRMRRISANDIKKKKEAMIQCLFFSAVEILKKFINNFDIIMQKKKKFFFSHCENFVDFFSLKLNTKIFKQNKFYAF